MTIHSGIRPAQLTVLVDKPPTRTHCPGSTDGHSFIAVHGGDHIVYMCGNGDCTWRETKEFSRSRWR